jgi:hypothetical protein
LAKSQCLLGKIGLNEANFEKNAQAFPNFRQEIQNLPALKKVTPKSGRSLVLRFVIYSNVATRKL